MHRLKLLAAALAGAFLFAVLPAAAYADPAGESSAQEEGPGAEDVATDLDVTYGFDNTARRGRYLAVHVRSDLDPAKIVLLVAGSGGEVCRYEYPATLPENGGTESCCIPLGAEGKELRVVLAGENGETLAEKTVNLPGDGDIPQSYVGLLCGDSSGLSWLDNINLGDNQAVTRTLLLTGDPIPEDPLAYDELDMIVISDYDLSALSDSQISAIREYVENGGILLFGGGQNYLGNYGPLADELLQKPYHDAAEVTVSLGPEYASENPEETQVRLMAADIALKNGSVLIQGENFPLVSCVPYRKGRVAASAFSLGNIADFCALHPEFGQQLIASVYGTDRIESLAAGASGAFDGADSVRDMIGTGSAGRLPNSLLYLAVLTAYLLLIGPIAYLALRRRGRNRYYLPVIGVLAVCFTILIYVLGVRTRFRGPFYRSATFLDISGGTAREETFVNLRSPYTKPYTAVLEPGYEVCPLTGSDTSGNAKKSAGLPESTEDYQIGVAVAGDRTEIRIRGAGAFDSNFFRLRKTETGGESRSIEGSMTLAENHLSGSLTSHYAGTLENAALILYGKVILLGTVEPEQTVDLDSFAVLNTPVGESDAITGVVTGAFQKDLGGTDRIRALTRKKLLAFYLEQNWPAPEGEAEFVAFTGDDSGDAFLAEGFREKDPDGSPVVTNGTTLICSTFAADRSSSPAAADGERTVYRCALTHAPRVDTGTYDYRTNRMQAESGASSLTLDYSLSGALTVDHIDFERLSDLFTDGSIDTESKEFSGNIYFYNYNTGNYDLMETADSYPAEELADYLSPSNTLTVNYVADGSGEYYLPVPYAVGTVQKPDRKEGETP